MKNTALWLCFVYLTCSCGSDKEVDNERSSDARLEIVDSIQVDLMVSYLTPMDIQDKKGLMLAIQNSPPIAYLIDPKGEIIREMNRPGDDPQAVGSQILSAEFFEDGIALMGRGVVKIYDIDFNLKETFKIPYGLKGMIYSGYNHLQEASIGGEKYLTSFVAAQTDYPNTIPEYYEDFNVLDLICPKTGEFKPLGDFHPESRFLNGKAFYFLRPVFHTSGDLVHYAFQNDTVLYTMDIKENKTIKKTKIPFDDFILFDGYTMGLPSMEEQTMQRDNPGEISSLFHLNGLDIITYTSGMKLQAINDLGRDRPDFREQVRRINHRKYLIMENGKRINKSLKLPEKALNIVLASSDGYLWAMQDVDSLEEEPDRITFYKIQIVNDR